MKKLTDADVGKIRALSLEGRAASKIAADFGVSRRHVARILKGTARPQLGGLDADLVGAGNVRMAVDSFLSGLDLSAADTVLAETARSLSWRLDGISRTDTVGAAAAAPQIAQRLIAVIAELRGDEHVPDAVDELVQRRQARLLANAAGR